MKKIALTLLPILALMSGCGSTNSYLANKSTTVEMYHIFDIKTALPASAVAQAAASGLSQNTNSISSNTPLQIGVAVPEKAGRFNIVDIGAKLGNSGAGAFMQLAAMQNGGAAFKAASCETAAWTARAQRTISNASNLNLYACLYKYKQGYELDIYAVFEKTEGGLTQVSRDLAYKLVGTPEEWVNKTIWDMVRSVEKATNTRIQRLEGQPELGAEPAIAQLGK